MRKHHAPPRLAPDGLPEPLKWGPVIEAKGLVFGALFGLGATVLLQQLGQATLDVWNVASGLAVGVALGIAIPSLGRLWGVLRANAALRRARAPHPGGRA